MTAIPIRLNDSRDSFKMCGVRELMRAHPRIPIRCTLKLDLTTPEAVSHCEENAVQHSKD